MCHVNIETFCFNKFSNMTILSLQPFEFNKSVNMLNKLFVYGTLKPGESMGHLLEAIGGTWEKASVQGEYIEAGSIQGFDYPGIILRESGETIEGYIFISDNLSNHWYDVDAYEGSFYRRVITRAELADGSTVDTHVYELTFGR
jgi:gamma-glutamylcyclotransferase (GGCT)/AIG2-like uncharacterized protein YtfP